MARKKVNIHRGASVVQQSSATQYKQLAPGEFIGFAERRIETSTGVVAVIGQQNHVERHEHSDTHFVLVLEGNYRTSADGADGLISAGQVLLITPGTRHDDQFVGCGSLITYSIGNSLLEGFARGERFTQSARRIHARRSAIALRTIAREACDPDEASDLEIEGATYELLASANQHAGTETKMPRWLERARAQLTEAPTSSPSLKQLAGDLGVHPVHLTRSFRTFFGQTPGAMARRAGMQKAATLLARTRAPICEIALECGFSDQAAFTKAFKRTTSASPLAFRKRWRN